MAALKTCASNSRFRTDPTTGQPAKLYWNATGGSLSDDFKAIADDKANYPNIGLVTVEGAGFKSPEPLDLVWTSQNYHDLKNLPAPFDINVYNKAVYDALKPGGLYIVLDHSARPDAATSARHLSWTSPP